MWYLITLGVVGTLLCIVGAYFNKKSDFGLPIFIAGIITLGLFLLVLFFGACMELWHG